MAFEVGIIKDEGGSLILCSIIGCFEGRYLSPVDHPLDPLVAAIFR